MTRDEALALLHEWTKGENLRKHALAVEAALRAYARKYGEDEEKWAITGLLHDMDYERHPSPEEHPQVGINVLKEKGVPTEIIDAILGHAQYLGVPRETRLARALYAVDELVGLITAVALIRPSKNLLDVDLRSIQKKWKDKAFAKGVNREDIEKGAAELGIPLDEHIQTVLNAMRAIAPVLGLAG